LQFAALAGPLDPLLDLAHRVQVLVQLLLVRLADVPAEVAGVGQHGVQHALVALLPLSLNRRSKASAG
jgi:hypothetical protein